MKLIGCFLLTFLLNSAWSQTSNWISGDAVWQYDWFVPSLGGVVRVETNGDSIIAGKTVSRLKVDWHTIQQINSQGEFLHTINTYFNYVYFEQDTVWYWHENQFSVLYDFTANVGNRRFIGIGDGMEYCIDSSFITLINKYPVNLNGQATECFEFEDDTLNSITHGGLVNSHFGMMDAAPGASHFLFPTAGWCISAPNDGVFYNLRCFADDSMTYNPMGIDCDYFTYLNTAAPSPVRLVTVPNPTNGKLLFQSDQEVRAIQIIDGMGSMQPIAVPLNKVLDLTALSAGNYILMFYLIDGTVSNQRIVKNE